jgi:hypothetical protein
MRPEHSPTADPCTTCGLAASRHRKRKRDRKEYFRKYRNASPQPEREPKSEEEREILGIDGEGYSLKNGNHRYTYLAASNHDGSIFADVYNPKGLRTVEVFDFLLSLPRHALKVGFALGYDFTKWLENLENEDIYKLYRPEERQGPHGGKPIRLILEGKIYSINMVSTKLSVSGKRDPKSGKFRESCTVWDLFKFFQRSFVNSLKEWGVGSEEELAQIQSMKDKRGSFAAIGPKEKLYCQHEVRLLAKMTARLIEACEDAGLKLRDFFGAGSLGAATLRNGPAKDQRVKKIPRSMARAVACAFFGGRFEQSARGPIDSTIGYDLASAYPYAETQLPCLKHGRWKHVRGTHAKVLQAVREARVACVEYKLTKRNDVSTMSFAEIGPSAIAAPAISDSARVSPVAWGPFPFRLKGGSILFPTESEGGWVWHFEALAAIDNPHVWPNVQLKSAWVFQGSTCVCGMPFLKEISEYYKQRLSWGKEGKGLVLKKGLASRYGKRAQTIGKAPFHCGVAAGLITSHTRSEILRAIAAAPDPWDVLSVATDGIIVQKHLKLREPKDTRTETEKKKPLGMWEEKDATSIFLVRPGMRFAIEKKGNAWIPRVERDKDGKESLEGTTAARGVGVKRLHAERKAILEAWKKRDLSQIQIPRGTIFHGAKLCIGEVGDPKDPEYRRLPKYGKWAEAEPFKVSFLPLPKRPVATKEHRLLTWALSKKDGKSIPYDPIEHRAREEVEEMRAADDEAHAQPDLEDSYGEDV